MPPILFTLAQNCFMNQLYFGDCLDILKKLHSEHKEGFIDLIYIDPPFNSKRNYNILFEEADLKDAKAQKEAFADTWSNISYKDTIQELKEIDLDVFHFLEAIDGINVSKSAVAYLTTMAIRIWYMHKVLKPTGSFYLHCDPTMSHYLKMICDLIFKEKNFRNEIIWKRQNAKGLAFTRFASNHDVILYYSKTKEFTWNAQYKKHDEKYLADFYKYTENETGRRYRLDNLANPSKDRPNLTYEFLGITRVWRWTKERMEQAYKDGLVVQTKPGNVPALKRYLDEQEGTPIDDIWIDIPPIQSQSGESLGYPTQKPTELLERILTASSNTGDLVADFFCGCGTTIAAAQALKRNWLGVDISHLSIGLIERKRLIEPFLRSGDKPVYEIHGLPKDLASAQQLASGTIGGRLKFQDWIIETKLGGIHNPKKTADGGWDGHITFEGVNGKDTALIEVKSGHVNVKNVREFIQVVNKQKAAMGIFVCFKNEVTKPMLSEAKDQKYYGQEIWGNEIDKIQIITVEDLLDKKTIRIPYKNQTFKVSKQNITNDSKQIKLL